MAVGAQWLSNKDAVKLTGMWTCCSKSEEHLLVSFSAQIQFLLPCMPKITEPKKHVKDLRLEVSPFDQQQMPDVSQLSHVPQALGSSRPAQHHPQIKMQTMVISNHAFEFPGIRDTMCHAALLVVPTEGKRGAVLTVSIARHLLPDFRLVACALACVVASCVHRDRAAGCILTSAVMCNESIQPAT